MKPLPPHEQAALCARAQAGDVAARNRLVVASMGLIYSRARAWTKLSGGLELLDLVSEGSIGLFHAIRKYDPTKGASFATYAVPWINQRIRMAIADDKGLRQSDDRRRKYARDVQRLVNEGLLLDDAVEAVASTHRVKPSTIQGVFDAVHRPRPVSLSAPVGEGGGRELVDTMPGDTVRADEQLEIEEARRSVRAVVDRVRRQIKPRDRLVLDARIFATDEATLQTIADQLSLSRGRIQQIEQAILDRLKVALAEARNASQERQRCQICNAPLRRHNRHGICSAHGRSKSFDARTGKCLICGDAVPPAQRGSHARIHAMGGTMPRDLILEHGRARVRRLRRERRSSGLCPNCGRRPPADGSRLCAGCLTANRTAGARCRRRQGHAPRQPITLTVGNETHTLAEWSRRTGVPLKTMWGRLVTHGWAPERVVEPVKSRAQRQREKEVCVRGHPLTPENVWIYDKTESRHCRACMRERSRARRRVEVGHAACST